MALPMKTTMKASPMKGKAMKAMKAAMKGKAMKTTKAMKTKRVSMIARGKLAKAVVFNGRKEKTVGGLHKNQLMKNKRGKVVSKKSHVAGKSSYKRIASWTDACLKARKELGIKGFCAIGGKTAQGKALYAKAKAIYAA